MTGMIHLEFDEMDVARVASMLKDVQGGARTAIMRAVNKSLKGVETDLAKETAKELALTQKRIKKDITVTKASKYQLHGVVTTEGRPVNLMQYGAKQKKKGVSVKVKKQGKRSIIPGTFIFLSKKKEEGEYIGRREKRRYVGTQKEKPWLNYAALPKEYRFPIETLYGPRIQDITGKPQIMKKVEDQAGVRLLKELDHQVDYILKKHKGLV